VLDSVHNTSLRAKLTLVALAEEVRDKRGVRGDRCWPGQARLATRTDIPERRVRAALSELEKLGWISRAGRVAFGRGYTIVYQLNLEKMLAKTGQRYPDEERTTVSGSEPADLSDVPDNGVHDTRTPVADKPLAVIKAVPAEPEKLGDKSPNGNGKPEGEPEQREPMPEHVRKQLDKFLGR